MLEEQWNQLIEHSQADSLFMSWAWQYSWWEAWHSKLDVTLQLVLIYDNEQLIGVLPLFLDRYKPRFSMWRTRLQFVGNHYLATPTVRTEYVGPIFNTQYHEVLASMVAGYIHQELSWDELIVCDSNDADDSMRLLLSELNKVQSINKVSLVTSTGYYIDTTVDVVEYKGQLGKNTRKKYFNDIKKLNDNDMFVTVFKGSAEQFLAKLNQFHIERWGKSVFSGPALQFHLKLIERLKLIGTNNLTCIEKENEKIGTLYNITSSGRMYNIQAGFLEKSVANLALGKVHLGAAIEESFSSQSINHFDMLAGTGKNSDYKSYMGGVRVNFETFAIVRNKKIQLNYIFLSLIRKLKAKILSR